MHIYFQLYIFTYRMDQLNSDQFIKIKQKKIIKIMSHKLSNDEQCFEVQPKCQLQVEQIMITKTQLLGDANPIYVKKQQQSSINYDAPVFLKVIPVLNQQEINSYVSFKFKAKFNRESSKNDKNDNKFVEDDDDTDNNNLNKVANILSNQINPFNAYYQGNQIVYCKYNNSLHNLHRQIKYFSGLFVHRDVLINKLKNYNKQDNCIYNMATILMAKHKNNSPQNNKNTNKCQTTPRNHKIKDTLRFDSNFQCGNLFAVFKTGIIWEYVGKFEYDLVLQNDINSRGSTQWFYFSVQGMEINIDYTFKIVNFTKNDSLFNYGMKPVIYSVIENDGVLPTELYEERQEKGWYRYGKQIYYEKGNIQRQTNIKKYYCLNFTINWKNQGDKLYIAHSYPYSYTRMVKMMKKLTDKYNKNQIDKLNQRKKNQKNNITVQPIKIGKTISGRQIFAYSISAKRLFKTQPKQTVIIMARQHPGQTQGSFVCQGVIKKLTEINAQKQVLFLLQNYLVYVIPMVNQDGVIFGNYRTNLCGKDLNRKWDCEMNTGNGLLTPQVTSIKQFIANLVKNNNASIRFVLDLHGHSKKLNSFFYGNPCPDNPEQTKIYPYICSRYSQAIQFMDCTFSSEEYKKKAARIYLSTLYQQLHIYTFQSSFYGYRTRQGKVIQFNPSQYIKLGSVLVNGLCLLLLKQKKQQQIDSSQPQNGNIDMKQANIYKRQIQAYAKFQSQLKQNKLLLKIGDQLSSGSESKPDEGELNNQQIVYQSQQQEGDPRVVVTSKICGKNEIGKEKANITNMSKNKSIRINSRKISQQNTIQYKQTANKNLNKKLISISQVNGVLADKFQISLLPIERVAYRNGSKIDVQTQTDKQQKLAIRLYKLFEIEEKKNLVGGFIYGNQQQNNELASIGIIQSQSLQPKKHSQIVAEIQKNSRHNLYKMNLLGDRQLINKRKQTQPAMFKQSVIKNKYLKKKELFTQTIVTFKSSKQIVINFDMMSSSYQTQQTNKPKLTQNQIRIARMQKINQEVLKIYSKKSAIIDLSFKSKVNKLNQKAEKRNQLYNFQTFNN